MAVLKERVEVGKYLVMDPKICHGALTFKGTRVLVVPIMEALIHGFTFKDLERNWPTVPRAAFREMLRLAEKSLIRYSADRQNSNHRRKT